MRDHDYAPRLGVKGFLHDSAIMLRDTVIAALERNGERLGRFWMLAVGARCATDITGFGLLGHMSHIARASKVTLRLELDSIPVFEGVREAVRAGATTDGAKRNAEYLKDFVAWKKGSDEDRAILFDPQTSGGLLLCVSRSAAANYLSRVAGAVVIGEVIERGEVGIEVQ